MLRFQLDVWRLSFDGLILRTFHLNLETSDKKQETKKEKVQSVKFSVWRLSFDRLILRTFHLKLETSDKKPETRD